jgi:hypothetical protein
LQLLTLPDVAVDELEIVGELRPFGREPADHTGMPLPPEGKGRSAQDG